MNFICADGKRSGGTSWIQKCFCHRLQVRCSGLNLLSFQRLHIFCSQQKFNGRLFHVGLRRTPRGELLVMVVRPPPWCVVVFNSMDHCHCSGGPVNRAKRLAVSLVVCANVLRAAVTHLISGIRMGPASKKMLLSTDNYQNSLINIWWRKGGEEYRLPVLVLTVVPTPFRSLRASCVADPSPPSSSSYHETTSCIELIYK